MKLEITIETVCIGYKMRERVKVTSFTLLLLAIAIRILHFIL